MPKGLQPLTDRQREVLALITDYIETHGRSPSQRDVAKLMGSKNPNAGRTMLVALANRGLITFAGNGSVRGVVIQAEGWRAIGSNRVELAEAERAFLDAVAEFDRVVESAQSKKRHVDRARSMETTARVKLAVVRRVQEFPNPRLSR